MIYVLMVSLDTSLVTQPQGNARQRHLAFAKEAGHLTIITYTPPGFERGIDPAPELRIIPSNSRHKLTFVVDAIRAAAFGAPPVDAITTQDPFLTGLIGVWLRRRFNVPLIVQNHSYIFGNQAWLAEHPLRNRLLHAIATFVRGRADMYRTVNRKERENYIAAGGSPERAVVLPLSTAAQSFAAPVDAAVLARQRDELGLLPSHKVVLWVGTPLTVKRVPLLLKVFRRIAEQVPDARLLLVGNMRKSPQDLPALVQREGIADRVTLIGPVAHDELPLYYALSSVYAHTSSYEGMGRVFAEASAAGLPLVAMNVTAVNEVIEDGISGYLTPDGDIEAMAARIISLLRDSARAQAMGEAARRIAFERYDAADYAQAWVGIWKRTVELGMKRG